MSPLCFTLKLLDDIKYSFDWAEDDIDQFDPYFNSVSDIVAPAILPPVNNTCEPVMSPLCFTLNFDDDIKYSFELADADINQLDEYDNLSSAIVAPAILPPVNNTCEPVISPLPFTLKFELLIK